MAFGMNNVYVTELHRPNINPAAFHMMLSLLGGVMCSKFCSGVLPFSMSIEEIKAF